MSRKTRRAPGKSGQPANRGNRAAPSRAGGGPPAMDPRLEAAFQEGLGLMQRGQWDGAIQRFQSLLAALPDHPVCLNCLGYARYRGGAVEAALADWERAIAAHPDFADAYLNLGNARVDQGRLDEAAGLFQKALKLQPGHIAAFNNLGNLLRRMGEQEQALALYDKALARHPGQPETLRNLGIILQDLGRLAESEAALRRSLANRPDHPGTLYNLAATLERRHQLTAARETCEAGLRIDPAHGGLHLVMARLERREKNAGAALKRLAKLAEAGTIEAEFDKEIQYELGKLLDLEGRCAEAFAQFDRANQAAARSWLFQRARPADFLAQVEDHAHRFDAEWLKTWTPPTPNPDAKTPDPVFLVGFPRSGTTLLEQVLDSHPAINAVEEAPVTARIVAELRKKDPDYPASLAALGSSQIKRLRKSYHRGMAKHQDQASAVAKTPPAGKAAPADNPLLLDKQPFNILHLGLIQRLFPDARVIVMLRHPLDVCLSCYMQDFIPNNAMANFFDMAQTVRLYQRSMSLFRQYRELSSLAIHVVRYEDLVDDLAGESRRLTEFLGLEWDAAMLDFHQRAQARPAITTPSYDQVASRIYRRARYRWERYREPLAPFLEPLRELSLAFGYGDPGTIDRCATTPP